MYSVLCIIIITIIVIIIISINIAAAGAVDRELLHIELGDLFPPHQQQQTTTINNNNNNQQWHVCVSPWNVGAGGRARGRARGGRRLILWTLLRQSGEAASARAKGPQRKVQKRDWCRKKCCNTFRIVFQIFIIMMIIIIIIIFIIIQNLFSGGVITGVYNPP